ncbi:MAG: hypothetical protein OSJ72_01865 [Lachnospiraceae bacterium]|nr:hypothetical protein [Lachnospiraceae bacterium]
MKAILTNETINILGGQKNMDSASEETSRFEASHKETKSERFKRKIKKIWGGILNVAEDIKEKIIPIVEPVGKVISSLITAVAVFRNSKRRYATGRMV